jgi:hypothetical protein
MVPLCMYQQHLDSQRRLRHYLTHEKRSFES